MQFYLSLKFDSPQFCCVQMDFFIGRLPEGRTLYTPSFRGFASHPGLRWFAKFLFEPILQIKIS